MCSTNLRVDFAESAPQKRADVGPYSTLWQTTSRPFMGRSSCPHFHIQSCTYAKRTSFQQLIHVQHADGSHSWPLALVKIDTFCWEASLARPTQRAFLARYEEYWAMYRVDANQEMLASGRPQTVGFCFIGRLEGWVP